MLCNYYTILGIWGILIIYRKRRLLIAQMKIWDFTEKWWSDPWMKETCECKLSCIHIWERQIAQLCFPFVWSQHSNHALCESRLCILSFSQHIVVGWVWLPAKHLPGCWLTPPPQQGRGEKRRDRKEKAHGLGWRLGDCLPVTVTSRIDSTWKNQPTLLLIEINR